LGNVFWPQIVLLWTIRLSGFWQTKGGAPAKEPLLPELNTFLQAASPQDVPA